MQLVQLLLSSTLGLREARKDYQRGKMFSKGGVLPYEATLAVPLVDCRKKALQWREGRRRGGEGGCARDR
jgi:hypothetical protein